MTSRLVLGSLQAAGWSPEQAEALLRGELPVDVAEVEVDLTTVDRLVDDPDLRVLLRMAVADGERLDNDPYRVAQLGLILVSSGAELARAAGETALADALASLGRGPLDV